MSKYTLYDYDSSKFTFKETVQNMMDVDQLDMIKEVFEFQEILKARSWKKILDQF